MSERGAFRGRGRGGGYERGGGRGGSHQGRGGGASGGAQQGQQQEKPKKENILDLSKYMDKTVNVKYNGGREGELNVFFPSFLSINWCPDGWTALSIIMIIIC